MRESEFEPGQAPVYPLPQRDPMMALADWGMPPEPPIRPDEPGAFERPWLSPGCPPWAEPERRVPGWAQASIVIGVTLVAVATIWAVAALFS